MSIAFYDVSLTNNPLKYLYIGHRKTLKYVTFKSFLTTQACTIPPVGSEMVENTFDGVVGITEIFFVEFFDELFFDAVDDALHADVGDHLL